MVVILSLTIIILILYGLFSSKEIYSESFGWDTKDGIQYSRAILNKFKVLPFYFISYKIRYKHPKLHPDYDSFINTVKDIKRVI